MIRRAPQQQIRVPGARLIREIRTDPGGVFQTMPEQRVVEPVQTVAQLRLDEVAHVLPAVTGPKVRFVRAERVPKGVPALPGVTRLRGPRPAMLQEVAVHLSEGGLDQRLLPAASTCGQSTIRTSIPTPITSAQDRETHADHRSRISHAIDL